jgi:hypothetical protein
MDELEGDGEGGEEDGRRGHRGIDRAMMPTKIPVRVTSIQE